MNHTVIVEETWIHHYDRESKQESMLWIKKSRNATKKKSKRKKSASKFMATNFWDSDVILLIYYLSNETPMNGQYFKYFSNLLTHKRELVIQRSLGKLARRVLLHQDNAPVDTARVAREALKAVRLTEIDHASYSADLAHCDCFLFFFKFIYISLSTLGCDLISRHSYV